MLPLIDIVCANWPREPFFGGFRKLLDVGGGSGAYDIELCTRYPNLSATAYDLPFVTEMGARNVAESMTKRPDLRRWPS